MLIAIPLGVVAAIRRYSLLDNLCTMLAVSGQAMPIFWLGLMLIIFFSVQVAPAPRLGPGNASSHLLMPAFTLGASLAPITMRMTRSKMLDILSADYIRTARAKGLREQVVLFRHALRNASIPIVTILGLQFGRLLGGAIVTEAVFAWPGLGTLAVSAIRNFDYPLAQACILTMAFIIVMVNLGIDVLVGWARSRGAVRRRWMREPDRQRPT